MQKIPVDKQIALMWEYHDNPNLQLIYKTFESFVKVRTAELNNKGLQ